MLNLLSIFFRKSALRDEAKRLLLEECDVQLGPMGHRLLEREAAEIARKAGNRYDVAVAVLVGMVGESEAYGLDATTAMSLAQRAVRMAKDARLPDAPRNAEASVKASRQRRGE